MPTRSKYGAVRTNVSGLSFDSRKEAGRYAELRLLEMAGEISELTRQVPIELHGRDGPLLTPTGRVKRYVADFRYIENRTGLTIWEDAKGFKTPEYEMKKAVLKAQGIEVKEV